MTLQRHRDAMTATQFAVIMAAINRLENKARIVRPQPVPPGTNQVRRMTTGQLLVQGVYAAVAFEAVSQMRIAAEFERREMPDTAHAILHPQEVEISAADVAPIVSAQLANVQVDDFTDQVLTGVGKALDLVEPGVDEARITSGLSDQEVISDLVEVGAPPQMVNAYLATMDVNTASQTPDEAVFKGLQQSQSLQLDTTASTSVVSEADTDLEL